MDRTRLEGTLQAMLAPALAQHPVDVLAAAAGTSEGRVREILGHPEPVSAAELLGLGRAMECLLQPDAGERLDRLLEYLEAPSPARAGSAGGEAGVLEADREASLRATHDALAHDVRRMQEAIAAAAGARRPPAE
ncbi:MAG TPA: hypothetical protein VFX28_01555 [Methylomirabilota bacterium]|nr:hypothetical protein [Methylomirabilota bacterium]